MRLRERVDVMVEVGQRGVAAGEAVWDVSSWDAPAATWSGIEPTFVALDGWEVLSVNVRRGRGAANRRHTAGTAQVVLGWRSPAGKWSFRPTSPVALGMELRVRVQPRSTTGELLGPILPIYRGAIRDIDDGWSPDSADPLRQRFRITVSLTDRFADLAAVNLPEQALSGLGDLTRDRVGRVMTLAHIPTFYLRGDAGVVEHQSSNFARNLLDEAQVAAESETGDLYVDREGYIVVREQQPGGSHPREDADLLTWSNLGDPGTLAVTAFGTGQNLDDIQNRISLARAGGTAVQRPDAADEPTDSQLAYGLRTYQRFDLTCRYDPDVVHAAEYWLDQLEDRTQRINQLGTEVRPSMPDDQLLQVLDVELRDRHGMTWTDGDETLTGSLHVQGIEHRISGDRWTIAVNLWAQAGLGLAPAPGESRWGSATWGSSPWEGPA